MTGDLSRSVRSRGEPWDLLVVGGGTAGIVGAKTAARLGARVLLVERERTGGDCLWTDAFRPGPSWRPPPRLAAIAVYSVSGSVRPARREQEQSGGAQQKVAVTDVRGCGHAICSVS